jgi:hypothetical protein
MIPHRNPAAGNKLTRTASINPGIHQSTNPPIQFPAIASASALH